MTGTRLAHYEIVRHLGSGGMGDVYAARDTRLGRLVALKLVSSAESADAERLARFEREGRLLASLNHPNIAVIHGVEESAGEPFLVMELIEGDTLAERLMSGPLSVDEALGFARQIVDALDAAHERGVIHRDIKPGNIKLTSDGVLKLLDFGLAKDAGDQTRAVGAAAVTVVGTRSGVVLGTASYMSPEQARGQPVDARADIWAFGCVLAEMLTGRRAFPGDTFSDSIARVLASPPDLQGLPTSTPSSVRQLLARLLEKDPKRRLRAIADARWDLVQAVASAGSVSPPRSRAVLVAALVAGVLLVSTVAAVWRSGTGGASAALPIGQTVVARLTNYGGTETSGALAPDGRSFAFVSGQPTPDIWLRQTSGGDPVRLTNDEAIESNLVYSPDGAAIYFTRREGGDTSIWQIGALGGNARRLVRNAQMPSPSRDARQLAWFARTANGEGNDLVVGRVDGAEPRVLVSNIRMQTMNRPSWSPDGRTLAYSAGVLFQTRNLFVASVEDGRVRQVTGFTRSAEGTVAQDWLPDNQHLVVAYFASPRAQLSNDLGILDVDTGEITRITMNVTGSVDAISLSADGARLIATVREEQREMWKVPFGPDPDENGRAAIRILDASQDPMWTYVTRDGQTLLFNNALAGSRNLWLMPIAGDGRARQLTTIPGDAVMHSSLSPDGTRVAFVSSTSGNADIWVQNVDGSDLRQLTDDPEADAWPVWSPDGRAIMFGSAAPGRQETRIVSAEGGPTERFADGFFRGDWIPNPAGSGTRMVTSDGGGGIRLYDVERREVLWEDRPGPGLSLPMFGADGTTISLPAIDASQRSTIVTYDAATGARRIAVRFSEPFEVVFRASWIDGDRAFAVNRAYTRHHIVLFDRLWDASAGAP